MRQRLVLLPWTAWAAAIPSLRFATGTNATRELFTVALDQVVSWRRLVRLMRGMAPDEGGPSPTEPMATQTVAPQAASAVDMRKIKTALT